MFLSVLFSEIAHLLGGAWLIFSHISGKSSFPQALSAEKEQALIARMTAGV